MKSMISKSTKVKKSGAVEDASALSECCNRMFCISESGRGMVVSAFPLLTNMNMPKRSFLFNTNNKQIVVASSHSSSKPNPHLVNSSGFGNDSQPVGHKWLPPPPQVSRPKAIYNATSLAYLGDCIYELYARRHFFFPPLSINEYNQQVMALVCCEAQDNLLKELLKDDFLSEEERDILRWGRNIESGKTRTTRRAGSAVYNRASSLETLVGYLYLTDTERLDAVMQKLGFSTSNQGNVILR